MAYSPSEKYPGAVDSDPNYKGGKFRDNNPSTTNNGSPLKAIDRNELLARDEAIMNDAGFDYNGLPDTPQDSQLFKAYKASLGNGANLLSNHNFLIPSPDDSQPAPSATPTSYPPGFQIFSGVFANETTGISNLTYIDGRVSFSGGDLYFAVPNTGAIARLTSDQFIASVADFDGKPRTRGVSFALVGGEYRVTVGIDALEDAAANPTPLGSVKFEQGKVATGHAVQSYKGVELTFDTVSEMKANGCSPGSIIKTKGFHAPGDGGGANYLNRGQGWPVVADGFVNHSDASGNFYEIMEYDSIHALQVGAKKITSTTQVADLTDCSDAVNSAIDLVGHVKVDNSLFFVDPSKGVKFNSDGKTITGNGLLSCGFLLKYNTAGSGLSRDFNTASANTRVDDTRCKGFSIFLNHSHQSTIPANIQIGFDMSNIGRTIESECYSGNYRWGDAARLYPNAASKVQAMRGYSFVYGNVSSSDPAYAGGEVHTNKDCKAWWARKSVTIDDLALTGGSSASYKTTVVRLDAQTVEAGASQGSRYGTGNSFNDCLIQDLKQAEGSTDEVNAYYIGGYDNKISGGYVETNPADLDVCVRLAATSRNNDVQPFYHDLPDDKFLGDLNPAGNNRVTHFRANGDFAETEGGIDFAPSRTKGFVVFDSNGAILNSSHSGIVVNRNGGGDFSVDWPSNLKLSDNSFVTTECEASVSGELLKVAPRHSGTTTRLYVYQITTSGVIQTDPIKCYVEIKG